MAKTARRIPKLALTLKMALVAAALLLAGCTQSADKSPNPPAVGSDAPHMLFVQDATMGTAARASNGTILLVLSGVDKNTLWFTDRPERNGGVMPTEAFMHMWDEGEDSFANDPPNAALIVHQADGESDVFLVELSGPSYHAGPGIVKYYATPVASSEAFLAEHAADAQHGSEMPAAFGEVELFIDSWADPTGGLDDAVAAAIAAAAAAAAANAVSVPATSGPLKLDQHVSIGALPAGPFLHAPFSAYYGLASTVTASAAPAGSDDTWTISCPLMGFDDRTFSCQDGMDRTIVYGDYLAFARVGGTPGDEGYRDMFLGVYEQSVWANEYSCCGNDVLRTWRLYDPRNLGNTAEIQSGDPVVLVDVADYRDYVLRHPAGGLGSSAIDTDNWLQPPGVPTDVEATWYLQRMP
jgi:hypothetical protein